MFRPKDRVEKSFRPYGRWHGTVAMVNTDDDTLQIQWDPDSNGNRYESVEKAADVVVETARPPAARLPPWAVAGRHVMARWRGAEAPSKARIARVRDDEVFLRFVDGWTETVSAAKVDEVMFPWFQRALPQPGDDLQVKDDDGDWIPGTLVDYGPRSVARIETDDGTVQVTARRLLDCIRPPEPEPPAVARESSDEPRAAGKRRTRAAAHDPPPAAAARKKRALRRSPRRRVDDDDDDDEAPAAGVDYSVAIPPVAATNLEDLSLDELYDVVEKELEAAAPPSGAQHQLLFGVHARCGSDLSGDTLDRRHHRMIQLLNHLCRRVGFDEPVTSIQVNFNTDYDVHRHPNNHGDSLIIGFGDFDGGALWINGKGVGKCLEIFHEPRRFDGVDFHATIPFAGFRVTAVFYCAGGLRPRAPVFRLPEADRAFAATLGFQIPGINDNLADDEATLEHRALFRYEVSKRAYAKRHELHHLKNGSKPTAKPAIPRKFRRPRPPPRRSARITAQRELRELRARGSSA